MLGGIEHFVDVGDAAQAIDLGLGDVLEEITLVGLEESQVRNI